MKLTYLSNVWFAVGGDVSSTITGAGVGFDGRWARESKVAIVDTNMQFKAWLCEDYVSAGYFSHITWYSGRPHGLSAIGDHGSVWGTTNKDAAWDYADQDDSAVRSFRLRPSARVIDRGNKLQLLDWLRGTQSDNKDLQDKDDIKYMANLTQHLNLPTKPGPKGWFANMTAVDSFLTRQLRKRGVDAAIMDDGMYEDQEIVVVNLKLLVWDHKT